MKISLKTIYIKLWISIIVFVIILGVYLLSFQFYKDSLAEKIEKINNQKTQNISQKYQIDLANRQKQLIAIFNQKSNKNIEDILSYLENKINLTSEKLLTILTENNFRITENNFDEITQTFKLNLMLEPEEVRNFFDLLINEWIFLKINNMKIKKDDNFYSVQLNLGLPK
ncbi:MAG: hypothetical protein NZ822_01865 [Patescibacteria group bacterium]|nr:hypothetical protein [Patescibacteria group bacterium]